MRTRVISLLCAAAIAAIGALVPAAPALASSSPASYSCEFSCPLRLGTTDAHVLHVSTRGLNGMNSVVTVQDLETKVYVYNNLFRPTSTDTNVWIGGLYGRDYQVWFKCNTWPCAVGHPPNSFVGYFANY